MTLSDNPKKDKGNKGQNARCMVLKGHRLGVLTTSTGPFTLHSGAELQEGVHIEDTRNEVLLLAQPLTICGFGESL